MIGNYFKMEDVINMNQETPPSNIQTFLIQSVVKSLNKKSCVNLWLNFIQIQHCRNIQKLYTK